MRTAAPLHRFLLPTLPNPNFLRPRLPSSLHPPPLHSTRLPPYLLSSPLPLHPHTLPCHISLPSSYTCIVFVSRCIMFPRTCVHACVNVRIHPYHYVKPQPSNYNELKRYCVIAATWQTPHPDWVLTIDCGPTTAPVVSRWSHSVARWRHHVSPLLIVDHNSNGSPHDLADSSSCKHNSYEASHIYVLQI